MVNNMLWCTQNSRVVTLALKVPKVGLVTTPCGIWFPSLMVDGK